MKHFILIADDENDVCELIRDYFVGKGYGVDVAHDGEEAMQFLRQNQHYSVTILDENMPGKTGLEIVKHIKVAKLPIKTILLTAYPEVDEWFSKRVGVDVYLQKPVDLEKIEEIVTKVIQ